MKLPTNPTILNDLRTLKSNGGSGSGASASKFEWDERLDARPHAVYRLLYSLQIIDQLMEPHNDSEVALLSLLLFFLSSLFSRSLSSSSHCPRYSRLFVPLLFALVFLFSCFSFFVQNTTQTRRRKKGSEWCGAAIFSTVVAFGTYSKYSQVCC